MYKEVKVSNFELGDIVKFQGSLEYGLRWQWDDDFSQWVDKGGASASWLQGEVTALGNDMMTVTCENPKDGDPSIEGTFTLPSSGMDWAISYWELPGVPEIVCKKGATISCECGQEKTDPTGRHSAWCPKYR